MTNARDYQEISHVDAVLYSVEHDVRSRAIETAVIDGRVHAMTGGSLKPKLPIMVMIQVLCQLGRLLRLIYYKLDSIEGLLAEIWKKQKETA